MLQYITNEHCGKSVPDQVRAVLDGGCRWIQIRMKEASDDEIREVIKEIMPLCIEKESFLILDDRVELAKEINVGGVHLGKNDMLPSKARLFLGAAAVIGVTANTFEDVRAVQALDVDYIGIGPCRHTETKKNLAPILGKEGIADICRRMKEENIEIPTVAIGGITYEDLPDVMSTGVSGVAVSGAIANSDDMVAETRRFMKYLDGYLSHEEKELGI